MKRICRELFKNTEQEGVNPKNGVTIHNIEISGEPNRSNGMNVIDDWLGTYDSKSRNQKRHNLDMFLDWLGKSANEVFLKNARRNLTFQVIRNVKPKIQI